MIMALFLVFFSAAAMAADMLEISDVRVEVDDDKQSANEGGGSIDITPESKLTLKVEVTNNYDTGTDGGEIEDVEVLAVLEDIDDGDEMEDEADNFDLRPGRDKTVTLSFDIPLRLETDETFKLILTAEGEDKNGTMHVDEIEFDVDVDKENHEVRFLKKELVPSKVSCSQSSRVRVVLINTGEDDEDVELVVSSPNLGYDKRDEFELSEDIDDDDNEYEFSESINLKDANPGVYTVTVRASYNNGKDDLETAFALEVEECAATAPKPEPKPEPVPEPVIAPAPVVTQPPAVEVVSAPAPSYVRPSTIVATPKTNYNGGWWSENKWLVIILITDLVLVIAGIIVIMAVLRRRK
jgi:hypothetical protein